MSEGPGIFSEIFNERGALLALFGALGGAVRSATLKTGWKEGVRVMFIGSGTSFGVGVLAPMLLRPWIGDLPADVSGALGTLCAASFLIGLVAVTLVERLIEKAGEERSDGERADCE